MYGHIAKYGIFKDLLVWGFLSFAQMTVQCPYSIFDLVAIVAVLGTVMVICMMDLPLHSSHWSHVKCIGIEFYISTSEIPGKLWISL